MNLKLRIVEKLQSQVAVVSFVEKVLELLEEESSPIIHLNWNEKIIQRGKWVQEDMKNLDGACSADDVVMYFQVIKGLWTWNKFTVDLNYRCHNVTETLINYTL